MIGTISTEQLITDFCKFAARGEAAFFVGAGLSVPSNLPSWSALLRKDAENININIREFDEDLPLIAQHIVNNNACNRGKLISCFQEVFRRSSPKPNHYHNSISRSSINQIWTTNYDTLLEQRYGTSPFLVRARDSDMLFLPDKSAVEIIKAHGCIVRSAPNELVITQEDYEDYFINRPLIAERLRMELQRKVFLFLGYGFGDRNIENILVEARRLARKSPIRRFLLTKLEEKQADSDRWARQKAWCLNLARIGIEVALFEDYDQLNKILENVSLKSRGATVYATGSHSRSCALASEIGRALANEDGVIIMDGQSTGISRDFHSAFLLEASQKRIDYRNRIQFYANPYAADSRLSNDSSLLPELRNWRRDLLKRTNTLLAFDGGIGTKAEVDLAIDLGCNIIPIPTDKDGSASELIEISTIADNVKRLSPEYFAKLKAREALAAEDVVNCVRTALQE